MCSSDLDLSAIVGHGLLGAVDARCTKVVEVRHALIVHYRPRMRMSGAGNVCDTHGHPVDIDCKAD